MDFNFYVYDFQGMRGILDDYVSIVWDMKWRAIGTCEIVVPLTQKNLDLFDPDEEIVIVNANIVNALTFMGPNVTRFTGYEGCVMTSIHIDDEAKTLTVSGMSLEHYLTYRVISGTVSVTQSTGMAQSFLAMWNAGFNMDIGNSSFVYRSFDWWINPAVIQDTLSPIYDEFQISYGTVWNGLQKLHVVMPDDRCIRLFFWRGNPIEGEASGHVGYVFCQCVIAPDLSGAVLDEYHSPVVFKDTFESVFNVTVGRSKEDFSNVAVIAGEGEGGNRVVVSSWFGVTEPQGVQRREIFVDARDLKYEDFADLESYKTALRQKGLSKLVSQIKTYSFSVPSDSKYKYRTNFNLGDRVKIIISDYNIELSAQVAEVIESYDSNGYSCELSFGNVMETLSQRLYKRFGE